VHCRGFATDCWYKMAPPAVAVETPASDVKPLLPVVTPTPADIVIAQSIKPKHISQIAEVKLGLQPEEYLLYGPTMAKVRAVVCCCWSIRSRSSR